MRRTPNEPYGFGSGAAELDDEDDVGATEDEDEDAGDVGVSLEDVGGLLCVCEVAGGLVVTFGCSGGAGFGCSCGRAPCFRSATDDFGAPEDTVTTTVLVLPSGATLVMVSTTSEDARSGVASLPDAASMEATVANMVATTTPPAASITAVPTRFFGGTGSVGDCG